MAAADINCAKHLGDKDTALTAGVKLLGDAIFLSAASNSFDHRLVATSKAMVPSLDPQIVIVAGTTNLRSQVLAAMVGGVMKRTILHCDDATRIHLLGHLERSGSVRSASDRMESKRMAERRMAKMAKIQR